MNSHKTASMAVFSFQQGNTEVEYLSNEVNYTDYLV